MPLRSAGLLIFQREPALRMLLVHPGGPYWKNKDVGVWQIPKGLIEPGEDAAETALREAHEELGVALDGELLPLGQVRQAGGKYVQAFALETEVDTDAVLSNLFEMEWPPRSGRMQSFPEVDAARWFTPAEARAIILPSQAPFLDRLAAALA